MILFTLLQLCGGGIDGNGGNSGSISSRRRSSRDIDFWDESSGGSTSKETSSLVGRITKSKDGTRIRILEENRDGSFLVRDLSTDEKRTINKKGEFVDDSSGYFDDLKKRTEDKAKEIAGYAEKSIFDRIAKESTSYLDDILSTREKAPSSWSKDKKAAFKDFQDYLNKNAKVSEAFTKVIRKYDGLVAFFDDFYYAALEALSIYSYMAKDTGLREDELMTALAYLKKETGK